MHHPGSGPITSCGELEERLSAPTEEVVEAMRRVDGDILLLGVGGKIGPSLAAMARRASDLAGSSRRIIGVSRFSSPAHAAQLHQLNVETVACDLLDETAVAKLPDAPNIIYLAGLKFGSSDKMPTTWAMNTHLPTIICQRYPRSRVVAYSTGGVYGMSESASGGSDENELPAPVGEYAMSCLGRERMFQYYSERFKTPVALIRLFYACELRYGVLVDLARKVAQGEAIDVTMGHFNVIWQGDNNAMTLRALEHASSPPLVLNVTGPETLSIREVAKMMGRKLDRSPRFIGEEAGTACLGSTARAQALFGSPKVSVEKLIDWVVRWVQDGGEYLDKPTHFEVRDGRY